MYFHAYDFFDNRTLLQLLTETTPQAIFPKRKIGRLEKGYEASFLVLGGTRWSSLMPFETSAFA